ncbi:MAG: hypothetical protein KF768_02275, partial [Phycisphaeraceae bacterium]|nr:hypothetical protein [Phycisphaeraceae bacterium]
MSELLGRFSSLSLVGKALVLLGVAAVIVPLAVIFRGSVALFVVLGGLVLVVLMLAAFQGVLSARRRKNSSPFEQALAQAGAATPVGISEPARRARMDDLRKSFDSGLEKFKAAGKSLYSLPWYLVVGEPGSGKTEAVRHCNVGFPPGLQDELQGSGGTLNMNWWFTNHAVLLDTAGRLMFEEVPPGSTSEWNEFLKLLRRFRPNCPVNGMLLVIPAESLITDSAEAIQAKASRIARQFDTVQRTLGVRFPVFVVITKADLINGFREFFDTIKEPHLQHQMLGWSNPDDLDTAFDPDKVDEHLTEVCARLARRRQALLLDPVHTEDPNGRRTDQVDALFAFPESLQKLGPRLRQYLSHIFVQGEWSAKPLFLRGIYFTSSMREGSALDADLAEALGLPIGQLPEGRVWERDRAFFLRDLFMNKVFRERGLVTRVLNTARLRRSRALAVLGTAVAGVLALAALTWFGAKTLSTAVLEPLAFWSSTSRAYSAVQVPVDPGLGTDRHLLPIVQKQLAGEAFFRYRGFEADAGDLATIEGVEPALQRRAAFPKALREAAERVIAVPVVFKPVSLLAGDRGSSLLSDDRAKAARALVRASVVVPLLDAARMRIRSGSDAFEADPVWSAEATEALKELVRLYTVAGDSAGARFAERAPRPGPLVRYAILGSPDVEQGSVGEDVRLLEGAIAWLYAHDEPVVVNASLRRGADIDLIEAGVRAFAESARSGLTAGGGVAAGAEPASAENVAVRSGEPASRVLAQLQTLAETISRLEAVSRSADPSVIRAQWGDLHKRAMAASQAAAELAPSLGGSLSRALVEERRRAASGFERSAAELQGLLAEAALNGGAAGSAVALKFIEIKSELERDMGSLRRLAEDSAAAAVPESVGVLERRFMAGTPATLEMVRTLMERADERVRASLDAATLPS